MAEHLVLHEQHYQQVQKALQVSAPDETCMFLVCKKHQTPYGTKYHSDKLIIPDKIEMYNSSYLSYPFPEFTSQMLTDFKHAGLHEKDYTIFYAHSHPFTEGTPEFSHTDHASMKRDRKEIFDKHFPKMENGWIVFNKTATKFQGLIIKPRGKKARKLDDITIIGNKFFKLSTNPDTKNRKKPDNDKYSRMELIPGWDQEAIKKPRIGLIGLGGNGASILQALLMMGIGENEELILVDHDRIEESNLSRIPYATQMDIGIPKVIAALNYAQSIRPERTYRAIFHKAYDKEAQNYLKGCDIIILAVDDELTRYHMNNFCTLYGIILIDTAAGVQIENNELQSIGGQIRNYIPGTTPCLMCNMGLDMKLVESQLPWHDTYIKNKKLKKELKQKGYFNIPIQGHQPSVYYLNQITANLTAITISQLLQQGLKYTGIIFEQQPPFLISATNSASRENCNTCQHDSFENYNPEYLTIEDLFDKNQEENNPIPSPEEK